MKIGVWINDSLVATLGGGASYPVRLLKLIDNYQFDKDVEICFFSILSFNDHKKEIINISQLPHFIYGLLSWSTFFTKCLRRIDNKLVRYLGLKRVLKGSGIKVVYYIEQTTCLDPHFPSVYSNWDIGHRSTLSFPELTENGAFDRREKFYQTILPQALMIICESETGKKEIMDYTNIGPHKIRVMPLFAGDVSSLKITDECIRMTLRKFGIEPLKYFYYPAQFWAHKNHVGLLKAFKKFVTEVDSDCKLVLSGSNVGGNREYVESVASKLGLSNQVKFLGFISEEDVYALYCNATSLVMASHFGPTNMPPIEAMELDCPVACSDLGGHKEILGDAAAYFNSFDYISICNALKEIYNHRDDYKKRIVAQKNKTVFNSDSAIKRLNSILREVVDIRNNWE